MSGIRWLRLTLGRAHSSTYRTRVAPKVPFERQRRWQSSHVPLGNPPAPGRRFSTGLSIAIISLGSAISVVLLEPKVYADSNQDEKSWSEKIITQVKAPFLSIYEFFQSFLTPDESPLLPELLPDPFGNYPRTLVVNFDKTLVFSMWTRLEGWTLRKRPYVDPFLQRAAQAGYEIVIWSSATQTEDAERHHIELDPHGFVRHHLWNHANLRQARWVKDLSRLRRDPKRVIIVTHDPEEILQKENVIIVKPFEDDLKDRDLARLIPFLENIHHFNVHDVRALVEAYNTNPNKNHFEEEEKLARQAKEAMAKEPGNKSKQQPSSWLGRMSGFFSRGTPQSKTNPPTKSP